MSGDRHHIVRLGHRGDGITADGLFAARTLPDEVITGVVRGDRVTEPRIETPSPERVHAPCQHYNACGGCQVQHAADAFVARWKDEVVQRALQAQGLSIDLLPQHVSPPRSRRRAVFAARRGKRAALAGFHARASDVIVGIEDCTVLRPEVQATLPAVRALAEVGASRKQALAVTVTQALPGVDVSAEGGKPLDGPLRVRLADIAQGHGLARLTWNGEWIAAILPPEQQMGRARVVPPPGAFLQATEEGAAALLADVAAIVGDARRVADLFAGCGTFALPLAERAEVHAVEGDGAMVEALERGWRHAQGLRAVSVETRDLFRRPLAGDDLRGFGAVVLDPPRAGAQAQVAALAAGQVPRIAYVSCSPTSFARDARVLCDAGYKLDRLRVVDQFRWSAHVELVAGFSRIGD